LGALILAVEVFPAFILPGRAAGPLVIKKVEEVKIEVVEEEMVEVVVSLLVGWALRPTVLLECLEWFVQNIPNNADFIIKSFTMSHSDSTLETSSSTNPQIQAITLRDYVRNGLFMAIALQIEFDSNKHHNRAVECMKHMLNIWFAVTWPSMTCSGEWKVVSIEFQYLEKTIQCFLRCRIPQRFLVSDGWPSKRRS
jgi:hypothetical protein